MTMRSAANWILAAAASAAASSFDRLRMKLFLWESHEDLILMLSLSKHE
jgi:hypothetical protein